MEIGFLGASSTLKVPPPYRFARLLHLCWELCCLQLLVLKFLDQKIVRPTMATMVLFDDVSLDTMASLRSEGIFSANIYICNHCFPIHKLLPD